MLEPRSKQMLRKFMAEISSMDRLQHKNLVQMRRSCRRKKRADARLQLHAKRKPRWMDLQQHVIYFMIP